MLIKLHLTILDVLITTSLQFCDYKRSALCLFTNFSSPGVALKRGYAQADKSSEHLWTLCFRVLEDFALYVCGRSNLWLDAYLRTQPGVPTLENAIV